MTWTITLRTRLMLSFIAASVIPLVMAAVVAVSWYSDSIQDEAVRALGLHASVANELFAERVESRGVQAGVVAASVAEGGGYRRADLSQALTRAALTNGVDAILFVDAKGMVKASSVGAANRPFAWETASGALQSAAPVSFVGILPQPEIEALKAGPRTGIELKETEGGSASADEIDGALSIAGVAPVRVSGRQVGSIVAIEIVKKDNEIVDSIVAKVGGVSTIFQNGVRVATTVKTDAGERAIGTAISDAVRAVTLDKGEPYQGEAFVVNRDYFTDYQPLKTLDGSVVGMVFVGLDKTPYASAINRFTVVMTGLVVLGALLAAVFAWFAARALSNPIARVGEAAGLIAGGDLTVTVPQAGFREAQVMGAAFNTMTSSLRSLLGNVSSSVNSLDGVAGEIASAANNEADSAASQASAVAEASATIEELDRSFAAVADGARRVLDIAEESLAVAERGRDAVEGGIGQVERLAGGAQVVVSAAGSLSEVAEDIGQVTFVIGSIAEQTKILALNAAIEAARAGEAGKGFGVVAAEIRTLADSVSTSIGRIDALVSSIQDASRELAGSAEAQANLGEETVRQTGRTRESFDEIYARMDRTAVAAREIATAASQQQSAARQIVEVMQQVSKGVSSTAASSRQLAESAADVKREASRLAGGLQGFKTD